MRQALSVLVVAAAVPVDLKPELSEALLEITAAAAAVRAVVKQLRQETVEPVHQESLLLLIFPIKILFAQSQGSFAICL